MKMQRQRGATMIIALIMIATITLLVVASFTLSSTNLRSVGNMQMREESLAAANKAIEQVLSGPFTNDPKQEQITVDIDNNGTIDYTVMVAQPQCIKFAVASSGGKTMIGPAMGTAAKTWYTDWDLDATVTDTASGARVRVHQGVRVLLNDTQKTAVCA